MGLDGSEPVVKATRPALPPHAQIINVTSQDGTGGTQRIGGAVVRSKAFRYIEPYLRAMSLFNHPALITVDDWPRGMKLYHLIFPGLEQVLNDFKHWLTTVTQTFPTTSAPLRSRNCSKPAPSSVHIFCILSSDPKRPLTQLKFITQLSRTFTRNLPARAL